MKFSEYDPNSFYTPTVEENKDGTVLFAVKPTASVSKLKSPAARPFWSVRWWFWALLVIAFALWLFRGFYEIKNPDAVGIVSFFQSLISSLEGLTW